MIKVCQQRKCSLHTTHCPTQISSHILPVMAGYKGVSHASESSSVGETSAEMSTQSRHGKVEIYFIFRIQPSSTLVLATVEAI